MDQKSQSSGVQPATARIANNPPHPNSGTPLLDSMLSNQAAAVLAKGNRIIGCGDVNGLEPLFKEIRVEEIVPLSMEESQNHYE